MNIAYSLEYSNLAACLCRAPTLPILISNSTILCWCTFHFIHFLYSFYQSHSTSRNIFSLWKELIYQPEWMGMIAADWITIHDRLNHNSVDSLKNRHIISIKKENSDQRETFLGNAIKYRVHQGWRVSFSHI